MNDADNYTFLPRSVNRSSGARIPQNYLDPL